MGIMEFVEGFVGKAPSNEGRLLDVFFKWTENGTVKYIVVGVSGNDLRLIRAGKDSRPAKDATVFQSTVTRLYKHGFQKDFTLEDLGVLDGSLANEPVATQF